MERAGKNSDIDRAPAEHGVFDDSKLHIRIKDVDGRIMPFKYPGGDIDWDKRGDVAALNQWRRSKFRDYLGEERQRAGLARKTFRYTDEEKACESTVTRVGNANCKAFHRIGCAIPFRIGKVQKSTRS